MEILCEGSACIAPLHRVSDPAKYQQGMSLTSNMRSERTCLEMTPCQPPSKSASHINEFFIRHFRQLIVVDNCPATRGPAPNDIAGSWHSKILTVDTMAQVDVLPKGRVD